MVISGMLMTSCTKSSTSTTTKTGGAAKPEGTFTFGAMDLAKENFIPWTGTSGDAAVFMAFYESLGMPNSKGEALACLAKSWDWTTDLLTMTVHLRQGIQFHDGWGEMTSEDVKWSLEQIYASDSKIGMREQFKTAIDFIEAPDKYTVVLHWKIPGMDQLTLLAQSENIYSTIQCKKYFEQVKYEGVQAHPIGTGPWRYVQLNTGDYLKCEAVENHWRVVPEFKYLVMKKIPEESTRVAMLQTGQIDACLIGPTSVAKLSEEDFNIDKQWGGANSMIWPGNFLQKDDKRYVEGYHNTDPWADVRVRQAMNLAINRDAMNKTFELGWARVTSIYCLIPGWDELEPYPYDVAKAKQLMKEAGYEKGFSLRLVSAPTHPGVPMIAKETETVASYWEAINIHSEIVAMDFGTYSSTYNVPAKMKGDWFSYRLTFSANPWARVRNYLPDQTSPPLVPEPELRALAQKLLAEPDLSKRVPIYKEFAKLNHDLYTVVPLFYVPFLMASNKDTVGSTAGWTRNTDTYYFAYEYVQHAKPLNTFRLFDLK